MRIIRFNTLDELTPYADDWDRLSLGIPFRSWAWLSLWWRHYGPGNRLAVLGVFDDTDTLVGIAPWYLEHSTLYGRVLRSLGSGEVCSDYIGLLCSQAVEDSVVDVLADYLTDPAACDLRWDLLDLDGIDAEDHTIAKLVDSLAAGGCSVHRRPGMNCWRLDLPTDWDAYISSLSKNLRRDFRRLERDLLNTNRVILHSVKRIDELPEAMAILVALHQQRREKLGEKGCFASPRFLGFHNDVAPELLRRGQAQFHWLELDGQPVAAEYQLVGNGTLYTYQAGIAPDAMEHQPGKLIYFAILRRAIEQGYRVFDFLRGDEPYKARFGAQARPSVRIRVVPRLAAAQLRHNVWLAGIGLKNLVKRGIRDWGLGIREAVFSHDKPLTLDPQSLVPNP
jgi:CelD/BcsL family acetyltransferase involved in cellulose biosynthesis